MLEKKLLIKTSSLKILDEGFSTINSLIAKCPLNSLVINRVKHLLLILKSNNCFAFTFKGAAKKYSIPSYNEFLNNILKEYYVFTNDLIDCFLNLNRIYGEIKHPLTLDDLIFFRRDDAVFLIKDYKISFERNSFNNIKLFLINVLNKDINVVLDIIHTNLLSFSKTELTNLSNIVVDYCLNKNVKINTKNSYFLLDYLNLNLNLNEKQVYNLMTLLPPLDKSIKRDLKLEEFILKMGFKLDDIEKHGYIKGVLNYFCLSYNFRVDPSDIYTVFDIINYKVPIEVIIKKEKIIALIQYLIFKIQKDSFQGFIKTTIPPKIIKWVAFNASIKGISLDFLDNITKQKQIDSALVNTLFFIHKIYGYNLNCLELLFKSQGNCANLELLNLCLKISDSEIIYTLKEFGLDNLKDITAFKLLYQKITDIDLLDQITYSANKKFSIEIVINLFPIDYLRTFINKDKGYLRHRILTILKEKDFKKPLTRQFKYLVEKRIKETTNTMALLWDMFD